MTQVPYVMTQDDADALAIKLQRLYDSLPPREKWVMTALLSQATKGVPRKEDSEALAGHVVFVTLTNVPWADTDLGTTGGQLIIPVHPPQLRQEAA